MKVFRRVSVLRLIATADVTARIAQAQMNPTVAGFQTFFAAVRIRTRAFNFAQMRAFSIHFLFSPDGFSIV